MFIKDQANFSEKSKPYIREKEVLNKIFSSFATGLTYVFSGTKCCVAPEKRLLYLIDN